MEDLKTYTTEELKCYNDFLGNELSKSEQDKQTPLAQKIISDYLKGEKRNVNDELADRGIITTDPACGIERDFE